MPGGDGTGPMGQGPMTGRRMGYCAGYDRPGFAATGWGFGRGMGLGRRFGRGLRWRLWDWPAQRPYQQPSKEQEKQLLEDDRKAIEEERKSLEREAEAVRKRLEELDSQQ
jgi:hypothetical protein